MTNIIMLIIIVSYLFLYEKTSKFLRKTKKCLEMFTITILKKHRGRQLTGVTQAPLNNFHIHTAFFIQNLDSLLQKKTTTAVYFKAWVVDL